MNITYFTTHEYASDADKFIQIMIKLFEYNDVQYHAEITDDIISVIRNQSPDIAIIETTWYKYGAFGVMNLPFEEQSLKNEICRYLNR